MDYKISREQWVVGFIKNRKISTKTERQLSYLLAEKEVKDRQCPQCGGKGSWLESPSGITYCGRCTTTPPQEQLKDIEKMNTRNWSITEVPDKINELCKMINILSKRL